MFSLHSRLAEAERAIQQVLDGARAADLEGDTLDFKEEAGTVIRGERVAIPPRHEDAARALAKDAACFANTDHGGVLIVGVNDKAFGPAAFVGADLDTVWLRERIFRLTQPNLFVDVIQTLTVAGKRVYVVDVAPVIHLQETWCDGELRTRIGRNCEALHGDQARLFLERRRHFDWSAQPSGMRMSQTDRAALDLASDLYGREHGRHATGPDLATRLNLVVDGGDDRELNNAGALLLCRVEPARPIIHARATAVESQPASEDVRPTTPLLTAFDTAQRFVFDQFKPTVHVPGLHRVRLRALPERALREAIVNAVVHRDYHRHASLPVEVTVLGDPPAVLKVVSPGGFPPGVRANSLIATSSRPRNPVLADAFRALGLAEGEGVGIDVSYAEMVREGHRWLPEIAEQGPDVVCVLRGGRPDLQTRVFFDELTETSRAVRDNVRVALAIGMLLDETPLRPEDLAERAQCARADALDAIELLVHLGVLERLADRSLSFRLTREVRTRLTHRLAYKQPAGLAEHWAVLRAHFDLVPEIGGGDLSRALGVNRVRAAQIARELREKGLIEVVGNARGPRVRYRLAAQAGGVGYESRPPDVDSTPHAQ